MIKKSGISGFEAARAAAQTTEAERIEAKADYIAMMCDIDIPTEDERRGNDA